MIRHADGCPVADFQVIRVDVNSLFPQRMDFLIEVGEVDNHTVAHDAGDIRTENARGKKVQNEFAAGIFNGMPCVIAALVTADNIILFGKQIDHAAFAFVAPVDAGDCS